MEQAFLRLFIAGHTPRSIEAVDCLRQLSSRMPPGLIRTEIVNVLESPELAEADRVIATPTLIRIEPSPRIRVVGVVKSPDQLLSLISKGSFEFPVAPVKES
ncbi:MAG: circadian clock KaiB family protein [Bryobacteraceae bacterium]